MDNPILQNHQLIKTVSYMSTSYFAKIALLEDGWGSDVIITVSALGEIESITTDCSQADASEILSGPLIPGMANLHSHAFQRAFAGFSEYGGNSSDSFWTWRNIMYQFVDKLDPEQARIIARQVYIEMLKAGYTSVAEFHYLHHNPTGAHYDDPAEMSHSVVHAAMDTGIAITLLPVYYRYSGFNEQQAAAGQQRFLHQPEEYHRLLDSLFAFYRSKTDIRIGIAPHSLRAVSAMDINAAVDILDGYDPEAPIHIHIAEQQQEVDDCRNHTGQRPVQHLFEHCDVDHRWCLIHATHINDQEAWELAESGAVAGLCLTTEANLGDGFFPAPLYFERKGKFGVGSDSHICVSPMNELRLLEYGQRLVHQQRAILCDQHIPSVGRTLYQGALEGGAQASGRNTGKLAVGYQADWLVLDPSNPAMFSKTNDQILDAMIFASNSNPVKDVMVSGKWQIKDGFHPMQEQSLQDYQGVLAKIIQ